MIPLFYVNSTGLDCQPIPARIYKGVKNRQSLFDCFAGEIHLVSLMTLRLTHLFFMKVTNSSCCSGAMPFLKTGRKL